MIDRTVSYTQVCFKHLWNQKLILTLRMQYKRNPTRWLLTITYSVFAVCQTKAPLFLSDQKQTAPPPPPSQFFLYQAWPDILNATDSVWNSIAKSKSNYTDRYNLQIPFAHTTSYTVQIVCYTILYTLDYTWNIRRISTFEIYDVL
jgi:hypothetical protein